MGYLDAILKQPGDGAADLVPAAAPPDVLAPSSGGRLFIDSTGANGLALKLPDGKLRALKSRYVIDVEDEAFLPPGQFLTPSNFEAALFLAHATAHALPGGRVVRIPAGDWPMTNGLVLLGKLGLKPSIVLEGAGRGITRLIWPASYEGVCVLIDGNQPTGRLYFHGGLRKLSICCEGEGRAVGVKCLSLLFTSFDDVEIAGFCHWSNDGVVQGVGLWVDGNGHTDGSDAGLENAQNTNLSNVLIRQCTLGMRLRSATQFTLKHVQVNQSRGPCDVWIESGNSLSWTGGMCQTGDLDTGAPANSPYGGGVKQYSFRVGASKLNNSGLSAVLSAPVDDAVTVDELANMSVDSVGRYLYTLGATGSANRGLYEIIEYVSPQSVKIRKCYGGAEAGVAWQELGHDGGNRITLGPNIYHEGVNDAFIRVHYSENSWESVSIVDVDNNNNRGFAELDGVALFIASGIRQLVGSEYVLKAKRCDRIQLIDAPHPDEYPALYDIDPYSRERLRCTGQDSTQRGRSLVDILASASVELVHGDEKASLAMVDGYVQSITGTLGGSIIGALSAGNRAVYTPNHPRMGGHASIGMRASGNRALTGDLAVPVPAGSYYGLFIIAHLPSGHGGGAGAGRGVSLYSADESTEAMRLTIDSDDSSGKALGYIKTADGSFCAPLLDLPANTRTFAILLESARVMNISDRNSLTPAIVVNDSSNAYGFGGVTPRKSAAPVTKLRLPTYNADGADLDISLVAVLRRPLTRAEETTVFRLATDYRRDLAPVLSPLRSGTFTLESQADALVRVDVSGAAATAQLRAGRAGDRVSFVLVGTVSNDLTVDPAGSELVDGAATLTLGASDRRATIVHDGSNWTRVS